MSTGIFILLLASAFLHALCNAIIKQGANRLFDVILILVVGSFLSLGAFTFLPLPAPESYTYLFLTLPVHIVFNLSVPMLYNRLDMSVAYTVMRGAAPLFTAFGLSFFFAFTLTSGAWAGIALLSSGILLLGVDNALRNKSPLKNFVAAVVVAMIISTYTIIDSFGIKASGNAFSFAGALYLCLTAPLLSGILLTQRKAFIAYTATRWKIAVFAGTISYAAYTSFLWTLHHAPVSLAAALRETGVIFALIISLYMLKESISQTRMVAVFMVFCGVALLKLLG